MINQKLPQAEPFGLNLLLRDSDQDDMPFSAFSVNSSEAGERQSFEFFEKVFL